VNIEPAKILQYIHLQLQEAVSFSLVRNKDCSNFRNKAAKYEV